MTLKNESERPELLKEVVATLLTELKGGSGDRDKRRQVEDWLKGLAEKYPQFDVESGLRDYYLAEATRLRGEFDGVSDLGEKLNIGRNVEMFLDKAHDYGQRVSEKVSARAKESGA